MEFKKMLDEEITPDLVKKAAEEKAVKLKDKAKTGMPKFDDILEQEFKKAFGKKDTPKKETPIVREGLDDEAVEIAEQKILDDENVVDIEDYFDKDDMAKGGIVSIR